jgi:predicted NBD/HSP70 family sugar kinase
MLGERGPLTRAQLSRATGLPKSSVSAAVAELGDAGVVVEGATAAPSAGGRGRPGTTVSLDPRAGTAVGLEFGFRHIRAVVMDPSHTPLARAEVEVGSFYGPERAAEAAAEALRTALADADADPGRLLGVGAGVALGMPRSGPARPGMDPGWEGVDFAETLGRRIGARPTLDNDANCAALAELLWGAGRAYDDFVYFKLHTGVGGAVVLDRGVRRGGTGAAGEFGHISLDEDGPLCRCGSKGCLETAASIPAVLRSVAPWAGSELSLRTVFESAAAGEPGFRRAVTDAGQAVGRAAGMLCNAISPQAVVVGGALAQAGEPLLEEVRRGLRQTSLPRNADVDVVGAALGRDAGALGAAALVLRRRALG